MAGRFRSCCLLTSLLASATGMSQWLFLLVVDTSSDGPWPAWNRTDTSADSLPVMATPGLLRERGLCEPWRDSASPPAADSIAKTKPAPRRPPCERLQELLAELHQLGLSLLALGEAGAAPCRSARLAWIFSSSCTSSSRKTRNRGAAGDVCWEITNLIPAHVALTGAARAAPQGPRPRGRSLARALSFAAPTDTGSETSQQCNSST